MITDVVHTAMILFSYLSAFKMKLNILLHSTPTCAVDTAVTNFAPFLAIPSDSALEPTMKPVMFCKKTRGTFRWQHSSMKWAAFKLDSDLICVRDAAVVVQVALQIKYAHRGR
jgi:hypothetical protein